MPEALMSAIIFAPGQFFKTFFDKRAKIWSPHIILPFPVTRPTLSPSPSNAIPASKLFFFTQLINCSKFFDSS